MLPPACPRYHAAANGLVAAYRAVGLNLVGLIPTVLYGAVADG